MISLFFFLIFLFVLCLTLYYVDVGKIRFPTKILPRLIQDMFEFEMLSENSAKKSDFTSLIYIILIIVMYSFVRNSIVCVFTMLKIYN